MSSYPPGRVYDERLLVNAPTDLQGGYNANLLVSDCSASPANARNQATAYGHASIEAPPPPTKEGYTPRSVPRLHQRKWQILLAGAIFIIGAVVGGVVGGTVGHKNNGNLSNGPNLPLTHIPSSAPLPTATDDSAQTRGPLVPSSTPLPQTQTSSDPATGHTAAPRPNGVDVPF